MPSGFLESFLATATGQTTCRIKNGPTAEVTKDTVVTVVSSTKPTKTIIKRREKEFVPRQSILTELFATKNGSTLFRMTIILSVLIFISNAAYDLANDIPLNLGQQVLWSNVQGIPLTFACWAAIFGLIQFAYLFLRLWAHVRSKDSCRLLCDIFLGFFSFLLLISMFIVPALAVIFLNLSPICNFGLLMEQMRLVMKGCSFYRVKIVDILAEKDVPTFRHFVYFLCAPTMIYKDEFPRSEKIRWSLVARHTLELLWCGILVVLCMVRVHAPTISGFRSFWLDGYPALMALVTTLVPTTITLLVGFFGYFHSFCNLQAELTGFQDRMFYKDWWNATSFRMFFTTWNTVIQDWLYFVVYQDVLSITGNATVAGASVFLVSGVVHEYVLSFFFRFFYPVLIVVFVGVGLVLKAIPTSRGGPLFGNIVLWICIPLGTGIITTCYMTEFFARINCPFNDEDIHWTDWIIPRSWSCPLTT